MSAWDMNRRFALEKIAAGALLASAGIVLSACQPGKPQFRGIDITGADYAKDFALTDFNGTYVLDTAHTEIGFTARQIATAQHTREAVEAGEL